MPKAPSPLIVSAPFGNYSITRWICGGCTLTRGSFTLNRRPGRWRRVLQTLRYDRYTGGWVNRIGLRNPGLNAEIKAVDGRSHTLHDKIVSVYGFFDIHDVVHSNTLSDWTELVTTISRRNPLAIELNLSCPNVARTEDSPQRREDAYQDFAIRVVRIAHTVPLIAKLSPHGWKQPMRALYAGGIRNFHLFNTLPVAKGGMSGPVLRPFVESALEYVGRSDMSCTVIAGGGVRNAATAIRYLECGADGIAVASALLNPFNWHNLRRVHDLLVERDLELTLQPNA